MGTDEFTAFSVYYNPWNCECSGICHGHKEVFAKYVILDRSTVISREYESNMYFENLNKIQNKKTKEVSYCSDYFIDSNIGNYKLPTYTQPTWQA